MTRWIIGMAVSVCVLATIGCLNVKVPEGPYVKVNGGRPAPTKANVEFTDDFLKSARDDGVITEGIYKELRKRLR